jgi:hypothetical protein
MSLLNFDSQGDKLNHKSLKLVLGVGALVGVIALGSTLAASINLNSGAPVEFGQGVAQTAACSGDNSIIVTPTSTFINEEEAGAFYFTSVTLSDIPTECQGADFKIVAYDQSGDSIKLTECSKVGEKPVIHFGGPGLTYPTSATDVDMFTDITQSNSTSFTLTWVGGLGCTSIASAENVYRITIESSGTLTGGGEVYVSCESAPNDAPSYYPCGPQQNVPLSTLTNAGWTQCYSEDFGTVIPSDSIDSILSACTNTYLAFLGQETTGSTALLMAAAPRASISIETPLNTPNSINGSWWYYTKEAGDGGSFGFAGSETINQTSCDFGDDDETSAFRYCLHINDNNGGFRIGRIGNNDEYRGLLNDSPTDYLKVVYQHN